LHGNALCRRGKVLAFDSTRDARAEDGEKSTDQDSRQAGAGGIENRNPNPRCSQKNLQIQRDFFIQEE